MQFAGVAQTAILVERALHQEYFAHFGVSAEAFAASEPSPVCEHYVSYLLRVAALEPFEVVLAAVLPCFWIYREVGAHIHQHARTPNPFQAWIDTYAGAEFAQAVQQVIAVVDEVAAQTSARTITAMHQAFTRATQLEWMFWDSADLRQPGRYNVSRCPYGGDTGVVRDHRILSSLRLLSAACRVCEVGWCFVPKVLPGRSSLLVTIHFFMKVDDGSHWKCDNTPEKCLRTKQLHKLPQWLMNLGSQRIMKMGCVVREPLHCLAAQPRETAIFEGEPPDPPGYI